MIARNDCSPASPVSLRVSADMMIPSARPFALRRISRVPSARRSSSTVMSVNELELSRRANAPGVSGSPRTPNSSRATRRLLARVTISFPGIPSKHKIPRLHREPVFHCDAQYMVFQRTFVVGLMWPAAEHSRPLGDHVCSPNRGLLRGHTVSPKKAAESLVVIQGRGETVTRLFPRIRPWGPC
jgi:hypothetical protein